MFEPLWLFILTIASHEATDLRIKHQQNDDFLRLSPGIFEIIEYPVISTMLKLEGNQSTISLLKPDRNRISNDRFQDHPEDLNHSINTFMDTFHSLFLFENSTMSMNKLIFDCGCDGTAVAKVKSSEVVVSSSTIISNTKQTPFVVETGLEGLGSSINVIDCSHISSTSMVLLPLVSTSTCPPTPSRDSSSTKTLSPDIIFPFLSVSGVALEISNVELNLGTGPLLDFGKLTKLSERSEEIDGGGISTVIVGSVLRNVTSPGGRIHRLSLPIDFSQKLVGTTMTRCTSHLSGTGCLDINAFGSVCCANTSFSHCSSNPDPPAWPKPFPRYFTVPSRFAFSNTTQLTLTFHLCTFTSMKSTGDGACVKVHSICDVRISECSFRTVEGCDGAALFFRGGRRKPGSLSISLSSFVDCTGTSFGAGLYTLDVALLSIDRCVFKNMLVSTERSAGGALHLISTRTTSISECVFMECACSDAKGIGGAIFVPTSFLTMTSVQFRGNKAQNGSDVFLTSGCGDAGELKERVLDCHTDTFNTSVMFGKLGILKGLIKQFGSATIVTSLRLTLSPTASEGRIEVETEHAVKGTMLLLLDCTGTHSPISKDSPPAPCRVVAVPFPTPSTTGTSDILSFGDNERLQSSSTYSLLAASISATPIDVASPSSFFTGDPPRVRRFKCEQGAVLGEMVVSLEGRGLAAGSTQSPSMGIPASRWLSLSVGPGGTDTRFTFGETYKVDKITYNHNPVMMESVGLSLVLPPFPKPIVFEVNQKKGEIVELPQKLNNISASFDSAFETATKMRMKSIELKLVNSETLSKTLSISDKNEVFMTKGGLVSPSLIVPATFSSSPLVVISVSHASLSLTAVDALIHSSSLDLKLVSVTTGFFKFNEGSITCDTLSSFSSKIHTSHNDLCSWTTGAIELVNSTAEFTKCNLTNMKQGAIIQRGGNVTLKDVCFLSNGPPNDDFPSARRNVMCSERGRLSVRNLTGDGQSHHFPGSGISAEACRTFGATTTMSVASLDPSRSTITRNRTSGDYKLTLVGGGFMPCGMKMLVKVSSDDGNSERSESLVVDARYALSCTGTKIVFVITHAHVANFSKKSEWKVRSLNGDTFYMNPWVVLRKKPSIMQWMLCVIVVVVVALLLIRRLRWKEPVEMEDDKLDTLNHTSPTIYNEAICDQIQHERTDEQAVPCQTGLASLFSREPEEDVCFGVALNPDTSR
ncbi:hypothetical protein BLNAU_19394 [Blattamonas nauphoetae]|uniref:Uncharacterized protein n=1 Tax=Blattamonas nauphoetae TaxID=2049346 RepID=A0ABQ9X1V0_9EUKA|nr:hypothetical protein BLNAU_19394 [Blattamonas nauphoetae]